MADQGRRRPQRRAAAIKTAPQPAASHYVGYVEDEETPESIARKFEELDRIRTRLHETTAPDEEAERLSADDPREELRSANRGELTEEQLIEVFRQTSSFTVDSAAQNNESLIRGDCGDFGADDLIDTEEDDKDDAAEVRHFWSGDDSSDYDSGGGSRKRTPKGGPKMRGQGITMTSDKPVYQEVTQFNPATRSFVRRRVRVEDPAAIIRIQVPPPPLPVSWGRSVMPWKPPHTCDQPSVYDDMLHARPCREGNSGWGESLDARAAADTPAAVAFSRSYQAVMVNPGWAADAPTCSILSMPQQESQAASQRCIAEAFSVLPLKRLCPEGFVFVWVDKRFIHGIVKQMHKWTFTYIENLTWVQLKPNNKTVQGESSFLPRSHLTLLMFRREGLGKDIELRHQRRPDVFMDCIRTRPEGGWHVPEEAYVALETLLPTGQGRFLEVWAGRGARRSGWTSVSDPFPV